MQAIESSVNREAAYDGTTIFAEDFLETGEKGAMRVRFDGSQVDLSSGTAVHVHRMEEGFSVDLMHGTAVISTAEGQNFEALVDGAAIRPPGKHSISVEITWVSTREFLLSSNHGDLEISLGDDIRSVSSGSGYRVLVQANDFGPNDNRAPGAEPGGGGSAPSPPGKNHLSFIILSAVSIGAAYGVVLSPSEL